MKSYLRLLFFLAVVATSGLMSACEPDTTDPNNPDARNAYVGIWRFNEIGKKSGKDITISYIVSISLDKDNSSQLILNNLGSSGKDVIGLVTSNQVVVSSQTLENGMTVDGSGENAGTGKMNWSYSIIVGGDQTYYNAVATKQ
jgi:hypothetical protein